MASIKSDGDDENDYHNTSSGHQRLADVNVDAYDPARDFLPPRSYVRKRQLPIFHSPTNTVRTGGGREVDEGLAAYKAASDQLARGSTWQRTDGRGFNDRKPLNSKSSASSISSVGGNSTLNDAFSADLIRGPVGSFAEDSPIRDRDSPHASYRASYAMDFSPPYDGSDQHRYAPNQTQDPGTTTDDLFTNRSEPLYDSNTSFGVALKLLPSAKTVTTDWNELFPRYDESSLPSPAVINRSSTMSPNKVQMATSKKLSMQDVFRSPPAHDLKKRHQLLSSPSFSFGGIDTPGAQSNGFSPVHGYQSDDEDGNDARKFSKLRFHSSFDDNDVNTDDEQLEFIPSFPPTSASTIPNVELEGVRRSPLQSSERKSLSVMKRPAVLPFSKSATPASKSSKKKTPKKAEANPSTPWTDGNVNAGNIRRMTMGELQSSRSLADINNMMRRDQSSVKPTAKTPKPKTPVRKKSPPTSRDICTKQAKSPMQSDSVPPLAQSKVSEVVKVKAVAQEPKHARDLEFEKSTKAEVVQTNEVSKDYSYPYRGSTAIPHHYSTYPTPSVPPFHHEYHSHTLGRSQSILPSVPYPPPQPTNLPMHYAQAPSSSPHIPLRYPERHASSPAIPPGYALPTTPRYQNGYAVRTQAGTNTMYSATHPRISGPPPPYGWPISSSAASRFSSPSLHPSSLSLPSSSRPTPARPLNTDKENANNRSDGATIKTKRNPCNCKKSRCLKLYCECFSAQIFCDGCNCADCCNTEAHVEIREKAMKELLHKNKGAFDVKTPGTITIGCKCKRSECLKKYCECFQAGIVCVDQCKCVSCANRAGSQKLIDKRRKMKDTKGAEYAMQISREVWEQQPRGATVIKPPLITSRQATTNRPVVQHRSDAFGKSSNLHSTRPAQLGPPTMGNVGFSPIDDNSGRGNQASATEKEESQKVITQPIATPTMPMISTVPSTSKANADSAESIAVNAVVVTASVNKSGTAIEHPGTPAGVRRLSFDSTTTMSAKKKQKQCVDDTAYAFHFFGQELPPMPSSVMTTIFQFISESDIIHTSRVCVLWKSQWGTKMIKQEQ